MKTKVFCIYDSKLEAYMQPFFLPTRGAALRAFIDTVNDPKTTFFQHPSDYTLFEIAEYDDARGSFENLLTPVSLGTALEHKREEVPLHPKMSSFTGTNGLKQINNSSQEAKQ